MVASTMFRFRDAASGNDLTFGLAALAVVVVYIDTLTNIEGAIAVLYVIATVLAYRVTTRFGLTVSALAFSVFALFSYGVTHSSDVDIRSIVRFIVALAALFVATMLLLKTETARRPLLSINSASKEREARYRSTFDRTGVAFWEHDHSMLRKHLIGPSARSVRDLEDYARFNPSFLDQCVGLIRVAALNEAARELPGAEAASVVEWRRSIIRGQKKFFNLFQVALDGGRVFDEKVEVGSECGENRRVFMTKETSMGMGLSIFRRTIEARGGKVDGNNHPSCGAIFEMHLLIEPEMEHA